MPTFMIGTQRSGSNLLRLMLNQLPEIAAPHPPHILQRMMPLVAGYGDLTQEENFALLVDDVCRLVEHNPVPWEGVILDQEQVIQHCREPSLMAVYGALYDLMAEAQGARNWCCKSMANIKYLDEIERYFDEVKYIYLYRDGRDVAVSFRKAIVGEKHFYHIAQDWAETQRLALATLARCAPDQICTVSYEDLTGAPAHSMQRLCRFLDVPYHEAIHDYHQSSEAVRAAQSSALWGNVTNPVINGNTRKFLKEASHEDIRVFELVAGDVLDALGYQRVCTTKSEQYAFRDVELRHFDKENERLKQEILSGVSKEDMERRDRQAGVIQQIQARQLSASDTQWVNL